MIKWYSIGKKLKEANVLIGEYELALLDAMNYITNKTSLWDLIYKNPKLEYIIEVYQYTAIAEYTNKRGFTFMAHYTPQNKYLGSVNSLGDKPILCRKYFSLDTIPVVCPRFYKAVKKNGQWQFHQNRNAYKELCQIDIEFIRYFSKMEMEYRQQFFLNKYISKKKIVIKKRSA